MAQLSPLEVQNALAEGAVLVDVREQNEWDEARITGARLAPMSRFMEFVGDLPADQRLVIQCRSGSRSNNVAAWLLSQGYDACNLAGGIIAWAQAGLPVES